MAKGPSFQELYARNQAQAEAESECATPAGAETCPTITLKDLLGASAQRYGGGDLAPREACSFDPLQRSFAFERGAPDLGGLADPNQAGAKPAPIALPDANADSLVLCGLADTLTRTERPKRERPRRK